MLLSLTLGLLFLCAPEVLANEALLQELYIAPRAQNKSEAMIFYNTANPCENCDKAINLTIRILRNRYRDRLHAYLINLAQHPEFISTFHLKGPLSLVIVRIDNGASFGYAKKEALQSRIESPTLYQTELSEFINNFFGWN